jgi:hypothetical protein
MFERTLAARSHDSCGDKRRWPPQPSPFCAALARHVQTCPPLRPQTSAEPPEIERSPTLFLLRRH